MILVAFQEEIAMERATVFLRVHCLNSNIDDTKYYKRNVILSIRGGRGGGRRRP
jgi:hypothetical protein